MAPIPADSPSFDESQLLAQRDFVRALTRRLVFGDEAAEELAQQTLLAAWTARPEPRAGLRGWLAKVALRLRDRRQRDQARRQRREQATARPEAEPSAGELAAQIELCERVAATVARLGEPGKGTLYLRYWHGLAPGAIAEREGVPLATVKSRLQRALAQLRRELDALHGGERAAWAATVIGMVQAGGVTMGAGTKVAAAASVMAAALLAGRLLLVEPGGRDGRDASAAGEGVLNGTVAETATGSDATVESPAAPAPERHADATPFASGRVFDPDGQPIAGASVVPRVLNRRDRHNLHAEALLDDEIERLAIARSDATGAFVVAQMPADGVVLVVAKEGFQSAEWRDFQRDLAKNQQRRFTLQPGRTITGTVRDTEGRALDGLIVRWSRAGSSLTAVAIHLEDGPTYHVSQLDALQRTCTDANDASLSLACHRTSGQCSASAAVTSISSCAKTARTRASTSCSRGTACVSTLSMPRAGRRSHP